MKIKGKKVRRKKRYIVHDRKTPKNDYLKYWSVVKYWAKRHYKLNNADLEMLLFLYTEGLFTRDQYNEYNNILTWDRERFYRLMNDGYIHVWRERGWAECNYYELTFKAKKMVSTIYKKLNGEEPISEHPNRNPMFRKNASFSDKTHAMAIKKFNQELRQRPSQ